MTEVRYPLTTYHSPAGRWQVNRFGSLFGRKIEKDWTKGGVDGQRNPKPALHPPSQTLNASLISSSGKLNVMNSSTMIFFCMYFCTSLGTASRDFQPPNAEPFHTRPVTSWKGRVEISWPAAATPRIVDTPQPLWHDSRAARWNTGRSVNNNTAGNKDIARTLAVLKPVIRERDSDSSIIDRLPAAAIKDVTVFLFWTMRGECILK